MDIILKGIVVGVGNIIPAISGSSFLIMFNLYDKVLLSISNIFKDFKKNILFLIKLLLGILIGVFMFSNIISFSLNNFYIETSFIFSGLLLGTIPCLFKKINPNDKNIFNIIFFLLTFSIGVSLLFLKNNYLITINFTNFTIFLMGFILAIATIIPGVSSTVIFSILGFYKIYLRSINTLNSKILIPLIIGFILGVFLLSKLLTYLLNKYYNYTYYAIIGFAISTIPVLIPNDLTLNFNLLFYIILSIISFFVVIGLDKLNNN